MTGITVLVRAIVVLSLFLSTISFPAYGAGRTNLTSTNSLLNGKGIPSSKLGINGDFYIDVNTFNIYGPKRNNKWPSPVSLRGPAGANGLDGKQGDKGGALSGSPGAKGEKGDAGARGPQGEKGEKGDKGDKGVTGEKGATGERGLTGVTGATGSVGATGAVGVKGETGAQGLTGAKGETGTQGLTGTTGSVGATGAAGAKGDKGDKGEKGDKGDTGTIGSQGPAGPSNAQFVSAPENVFQTTTPGTGITSAGLGILSSGNSFTFVITVRVKVNSNIGQMAFTVGATGAGNVLNYEYSTTSDDEYRNGGSWKGRQFTAIGSIQVGTIDASLNFTIIDIGGSSQFDAFTIAGSALITRVESLS